MVYFEILRETYPKKKEKKWFLIGAASLFFSFLYNAISLAPRFVFLGASAFYVSNALLSLGIGFIALGFWVLKR